MPTPTRGRFGVKTATLTFGSNTYDIASMPIDEGFTRDAIDVTALADTIKQYIQGAVVELDEFTVTVYKKATGNIDKSTAPGALTISVTLENGVDDDATATVSFNRCLVVKVSPPSIDASSDRKAVYDVTFRPDGTTAA